TKKTLDKIQQNLYTQAMNIRTTHLHRTPSLEDAQHLKGIIELPWCGIENCALEIESILEGNTLGEPISKEPCEASCPICGQSATTWMRYAKSY
ncbi:MAG: proline--tRNA ligase, partial [Candidatus Thermoplasmatota archaeon]|nr:proline--tRNA ligase [Candidatus Thermoplasmatota archaeon]